MFASAVYALLLLVAIYLWRHLSHRSTNVPIVPGLPLLGNLIALGRGGVAFISQCREKFGDIFCLRLLTQRMIFVFDPDLITFFLKAPESSVSFKPAVEQFTDRVYGIPSAVFFPVHEQLLATLRDLLSPDKLKVMAQQLLQNAEVHLQEWKKQGRVELWSAVQTLVFSSAGRVLFGEAFFLRHGMRQVQEAFLTFEGYFEVAASPIPHLLLPKFRSARAKLLSMFSVSLSAGDFTDTVVGQLLQGCGIPAKYWPNLLLAILWASQANSMPALFWCIAMLLSPEQHAARKQIMQELQNAVIQQEQQEQQQQMEQDAELCAGDSIGSNSKHCTQQGGKKSVTSAAMIALAMDRRSYAARCAAEAIRLRAHSIAVRFVSANNLTFTINNRAKGCHGEKPADAAQRTLHIPQGAILAICPFISHHDERLYPEAPWQFNPNRSEVQGLAPGTVAPGLAGLGFGGGFWRCPGRFFAEMELVLLLQLVLQRLPLTPEVVDTDHHSTDEKHINTDGPGAVHRFLISGSKAIWHTLSGWLGSWGHDRAVYGAGMFGGSQLQAAAWYHSADQRQLLPPPDLQRLVGFKVPQCTWWMRVQ